MRICIVYDCLYPHTIGGAERWYRNLALRLAQAGHDVTYLTMRQWERTEPPELAGVSAWWRSRREWRSTRTSGGESRLRSCSGSACSGICALHGANYDVVHTASFPYFSLLAAASARPVGRYQDRRRLARGVDARVLERVSRPPRCGRLPGPASVRRRKAGGVLLLGACTSGGCGARASPARSPCSAACTRAAPKRRAAARRAGRRVRGPSHPGEARHGRGSGVCTGPRAGAGPPVCDLRRRARASRGASADRSGRTRGRRRGTRIRGAGARRAGATNRALSRPALAPRRLRPRRRRGGGPGDAVGRRPRAGQRGGRARRGRRQRLRRGSASREDLGAAIVACTVPVRLCDIDCRGSNGTPRHSRSRPRSDSGGWQERA